MINEHLGDLEAVTSTKRACVLLGASRATVYRRRLPPPPRPLAPRPLAPRPEPANKLTETERHHLLSMLRSEQYCEWVGRGLTAYDAEYVALAAARSCALITDDAQILAAAPSVASALIDNA